MFDDTRVAVATAPISDFDRSFDAGAAVARLIDAEGLRHLFVVSEGLAVNVSEVVNGINSVLPPRVTVTGGFAGDGNRLQRTAVVG